MLDPLTHAVRRDLADIRLADRVFAPHYAAPMPRTIAAKVSLRTTRDANSAPLVELHPGEMFEVFELSGGNAWGIAVAQKLVGYIDETALTAGPST